MDLAKRTQVGPDVDRHSEIADPIANRNAQMNEQPVMGPHARTVRLHFGRDIEAGNDVERDRTEPLKVAFHIEAETVQRHYGISRDLPRGVQQTAAAAIHPAHRPTACRQFRRFEIDVLAAAGPANGNGVVMFGDYQCGGGAITGHIVNDAPLQAQHRIELRRAQQVNLQERRRGIDGSALAGHGAASFLDEFSNCSASLPTMSGSGQAWNASGAPGDGMSPSDSAGRRTWLAAALVPATILCLLNIAKPLVVDDTAYHAYAVQIARNLADPYGFTIDWYERPKPAFEVLAPPVLPYWWAMGIRLFGDDPWLAKAWLWPWCAVLSLAVRWLAGRFCSRIATPITWFIVLSPSVMPSLNLMLDVPALALSLSALALFLRTERELRWFGAIAAGLIAGIAAQTKYTALLIPVELVLAAVFSEDRPKQLVRATLAVAAAALVFGGWEWFVSARYGQSHFLFHLAGEPGTRFSRSLLFWPMIGLLGSVAAPLGLLSLVGRGVGMLGLVLATATIAAGFGLVAVASWDWPMPLSPNASVFGPLGLAITAIVAMIVLQRTVAADRTREDDFLVAWLFCEVVGYFVLTPWPAVRRIIGMLVPATFIVGRAAEIRGVQRSGIWFAVSVNATLALLFQVIDIENARIEQSAVAAIDARIRSRGGGRVWFFGRRGWQYYAEQAGWRPARLDITTVAPGDWLVVPDAAFGGPRSEIPKSTTLVETIEFRSRFPVATIPWFYGTNAAVRKTSGPFMTVTLFRAAEDGRLVPVMK